MAASADKDTKDFLKELKSQASQSAANASAASSNSWTDPNDGTTYEWDNEKQGWFPKVDEDFLAAYQMNYGFNEANSTEKETSESNVSTVDDRLPQPVAGENTERDQSVSKEESLEKGKKRKAKEEPVWFEMDQSKNTNVYVSGLPLDISDDEFTELMLKYGIIMEDPDTNKLKIKLYRDEHGQPKGDGRCCYLKIESVSLAIELLDETEYKGSTLHVEQAEFHMKGAFNPALKKKKKKKKKKPGKGQEKLLDWVDRDNKRPKNERVVVIRNMFDAKEFEKEPGMILDLRNDLRKECEKYGEVRKVIVFDRNQEGICSVAFKDHESADACETVMNGRWFAGRKLLASKWDGATNFNTQESEKDLADRMKNWEKYLYGEEDETPKANADSTSAKK